MSKNGNISFLSSLPVVLNSILCFFLTSYFEFHKQNEALRESSVSSDAMSENEKAVSLALGQI